MPFFNLHPVNKESRKRLENIKISTGRQNHEIFPTLHLLWSVCFALHVDCEVQYKIIGFFFLFFLYVCFPLSMQLMSITKAHFSLRLYIIVPKHTHTQCSYCRWSSSLKTFSRKATNLKMKVCCVKEIVCWKCRLLNPSKM